MCRVIKKIKKYDLETTDQQPWQKTLSTEVKNVIAKILNVS